MPETYHQGTSHKVSMIVILFIIASTFSTIIWADDNIREIENADGSIEFTNISGNKKNHLLTKDRKTATTVIYKYPESSTNQTGHIVTYSDQKPLNKPFEMLKFDCYACDPTSPINWHTTRLNRTAYFDHINQAAQKYTVDPALIRALIHAESSFNPTATSSQGAQGLMQLMPATAKEMGVNNALNAQQNIQGGVKYLAYLLQTFKDNVKLATAAYNAGPSAVKKYGGVPPYTETQVYVERVAILHKRYQQDN